MRSTRALIVVGIAIAGVVWWRSSRHVTPAPNDTYEDFAKHVVRDIASVGGGGVRWHVSTMPNERGTQNAINVYNDQNAPAHIDDTGLSYVETPTWTIALDLERVTEIVCVETFIHQPPPGFLMRDFSFRKGPDKEYGDPDEMLSVMFMEDRHAEFDRICDKHRLRRER